LLGVAGGAGVWVTVWVKEASRVTVWPLGSVVVTVRVPLPSTTEVSTLRSMVLPFAVVITWDLSQVPGATFVSVDVKVSCFPLAVVMVPCAEMEPGAVRTAVPCHEVVAPLGLVAEPLKFAVCVDLFQVRCDCTVPVPPFAFVQEPFLSTVPLERVVTDEVVPEPPLLVVWVPVLVTVVVLSSSPARAGFARTSTEPAMVAEARRLRRGRFFMRGMIC